ncbi:MAG TPA: hypothetical protein VJ870_00870 [Amycolatopsis sp.]|nr:hypothetical protein [Amycolatopsis sp.]
MFSNPVRAAVAGTLVAAGMLGGTAGIAEAQTAQAAPRVQSTVSDTVMCSTVDTLETALRNLSTAVNPSIVDIELANVIALLQQYPPVLPPALMSTYQWLVVKFQILRGIVAALPTPQLIQLVNSLAADLADALDGIPCVAGGPAS